MLQSSITASFVQAESESEIEKSYRCGDTCRQILFFQVIFHDGCHIGISRCLRCFYRHHNPIWCTHRFSFPLFLISAKNHVILSSVNLTNLGNRIKIEIIFITGVLYSNTILNGISLYRIDQNGINTVTF